MLLFPFAKILNAEHVLQGRREKERKKKGAIGSPLLRMGERWILEKRRGEKNQSFRQPQLNRERQTDVRSIRMYVRARVKGVDMHGRYTSR